MEVPKELAPVQPECPEPLPEELPLPVDSSHVTITQSECNSSQVDAATTEESLRVPDERSNSTLPSKGSAPLSKTPTTTSYGRVV